MRTPDVTEQVVMVADLGECTFCGRTTDAARPIYGRGTLPGDAPFGYCCARCDGEASELAARFVRISQPRHRDRLAFDSGRQRGSRLPWRKARRTGTVDELLAGLQPVAPSAARITAVTESVFVPAEPRAHPDRGSALADMADRITTSLGNATYTSRFGTVGSGAGVLVEQTIDDLLSSQYVYLLDTGNAVHDFYWYSH